MSRSQLRAIQRHNKKAIEKQSISKIMQNNPRKTVGFGVTITNRKIAVMIWSSVFVLWSAKD